MSAMSTPLKIVPTRTSQREAVAWFVAGRDPDAWLTELARWNVPLESLGLRPVPRSAEDATPLGVLVTCDGVANAKGSPFSDVPMLALPYGRAAGRVYLPVEAVFDPVVSERELDVLLSGEGAEYVWHPSAGLIRIEPHERLRVCDLLEPAPRLPAVWDRAVAGIAFRSRLLSVEAEETLSVEEILKSAAQDIGSNASSLDALPPMPNELFGGLLHQISKPFRNGWRALTNWLRSKQPSSEPPPDPSSAASNASNANPGAGGVMATWLAIVLLPLAIIGAIAQLLLAGLGALLPLPLRGLGRGSGSSGTGTAGRSGPGWSGFWPSWMKSAFAPLGALAGAGATMMRKLGSLSFVNQAARNREIDRLLHLLKNDPDAGLKFALPMGSHSASRGIASPWNQLLPRNIDFSLGGLFRSGPVDAWSVPPEQQFQLVQMYRELAAREIRLGRHRRAAYIHAELLGDLASAATALEAGHHYREAAVLYRDRLKRPVDAAKCLERGGLLDEAAEMYVELGMMEQAADVYVRLERQDEAERLLRTWVGRLTQSGQYQTASRVLHDKLHDVDGALEALALAWPNSAVAQACLEESFAMLGLHARHDEANHRISSLRDAVYSGTTTKALARALSGVASSYPEQAVRNAANDATQVVVARRLIAATPHEASELLGPIRHLALQDRLLNRDCDRFVRQREAALRARPTPSRQRSRGLALIKSFRFPPEKIRWQQARAAGHAVYLAGFLDGGLIVRRAVWSNTAALNMNAFWAGIGDDYRIVLDPHPGDHGFVIVHAIGHEPLEHRGIPVLPSEVGVSALLAGSPSWATKSTVAMAYADGGFCWRVRDLMGAFDLDGFSAKGELLTSGTFVVPTPPDAADPSPTDDGEPHVVALHASSQRVRIGIGRMLCRPQLRTLMPEDALPTEWVELSDPIQSLCGVREEDSAWLVALFDCGGVLIREPFTDHQPQAIGEGLESPVATFLPRGRLAIAGRNECRVYQLDQSRAAQIGQMPLDIAPFAVTPTDKLGELAIFGIDGTVRILTVVK